jgi:glycosyltransferase 2 family protein
VSGASAAAEAATPVEPRRFGLLTVDERGRRNRRTGDVVVLAAASVLVGLAAAIASQARDEDARAARGVITLLGWAEVLWRTVFVSALVLAAVVVVAVFVRRRWLLARDLVAVVAVEAALAVLLGWAVISDWFPFEAHLLSNWGFPEARLAAATGILVVAAPELVRPVRRLAATLVPLAALAAVALAAALPSAALAALTLGLASATLVRLAFGTAAGFPPAELIRSELASLGVETRDLRAAEQQRVGSAFYVGDDADGGPLKVRVLGRDAQDTQRVQRGWRSLAYRDPPRSVAVGRLEQVEHEGLATLMAAQAGVRVPEVVTAAMSADGNALIVTRQPDVDPLEEADPQTVTDELLQDLWKQVARLHATGISHGRLNARNVAVLDGKPMILDLAVATLGAPRSAIDIDVAELLVACTVLVGPDRALAAAIEGAGADAVRGALPYLERGALTPHERDLAHDHEVELDDLRKAAAAATHEQVPELVPLRRVRARDFLYTAAVAFAAYLLISKLAKIGFGTIYDELRSSDLVWVAVALILAQLTYITQAIALRGAVTTPLPLGPCVALQSAIKFVNLTVPSAAGAIALSVRFLQKLGVPTGAAVASGAIDGLSDTLVQILLVVALLPFVNFHLDTKQLSGALPSGTFVAVIFAVLVIGVGVVLAVPALRRKVVPEVRAAFRSLWEVARSGRKLAELFGGTLATEVIFALTLAAACRAYGVHLGLAQVLLVNVLASSLAGLVPVPGGIGAAEAALAGGLVALGVPESVAFAAALTHRLCTYYTPPIWGYFSLRWLRHTGHV